MNGKVFTPEGSKLIPLTQCKFAIVDADDYERLSLHKWYAHRSRNMIYAGRQSDRCCISMHRVIMNAPKGMVCDHINHNGLDNRKCNLRVCTVKENSYNRSPLKGCTSKYKGVCWLKKKRKWMFQIRANQRSEYYSGVFSSEAEAALAYDLKADELFGRFAYLNFPQFLDAEKWLQGIFNPV